MSDNPEALPELPRPHFEGWKRGGLLCEDGFTAFQMRAYARAALAQQAATPTGPELLSDAVAEEIDELLGVIFQSARYERPSTDARPALEAFYRRHADLAEQAETLFGRMHARITELEAQIEQAATPAPAEPVSVHPQSLRGLVESCGGNYLTGGGAAFTSAALAKFVEATAEAAVDDYTLTAAPPATPAAQPADEREARVDPWYGRPMPRADFLRAALCEIADSKSLTATPTQFYQHLQRIAFRALTADAKAEQSEPAGEREAFEAWAVAHQFDTHRDESEKYRDYHRATTRWAWLAWQARAALEGQG